MILPKEVYEDFKSFIDDDVSNDMVKEFLEENFPYNEKNDSKNILKRLEIMTCTCCNLNCKYCYANGGSYNQEEIIMSKSINNKILARVLAIPNDIEEVKFFGGEPFLGYECILNTCEWFTRNYNRVPKFKVVTNLTYLPDALLKGIKKYNVILTVSLDGPEDINNQFRISKNKDMNVYQTVIKNVERIHKIGYPIQAIECTYTKSHQEKGYTKEWLKKYFEREFNVKQVIIADEYHPENEVGFNFDYKKYFSSNKIDDLIGFELVSRCISKNHKGGGLCQVGNRGLTFLPNGDIYPCHMFVYNENYKIGNVLEGELLENIARVQLQLNSIREQVGCNTCKARNICSQCFKDFIFDTDNKMLECKDILEMNEYCLTKICKFNIETVLSKSLFL